MEKNEVNKINMQDKELLKRFYIIADELDKNIIELKTLEDKLKIVKEKKDFKAAEELLEEYKKISNNIKKLKSKSEELKNSN